MESDNCEPIRKNFELNLVSVDVTNMEEGDRDTVVKEMNKWVQKFKTQYKNLIVKLTTNNMFSNSSNKIDQSREYIVLQGIRKENEDEFRKRMGISDDNSWSVQYAKLTKCSKSEAKDEMIKMCKNGKPLTPGEWQKQKYDNVEEFLNIVR